MNRRVRALCFSVISLLLLSFPVVFAQVYAPYNQGVSDSVSDGISNSVFSGVPSGIVSNAANSVSNLELTQQKLERARQINGRTQATVDQPAWRDALANLEWLYQSNPLNLDVLYLGTTSYNEVGWDYITWEYGRAYIEAGGLLDDYLLQILTTVGNDLGYSYYKTGNIDFALSYFEAVSRLNVYDWLSVQEIGRIYSESGFPQDAVAYWQEAIYRGSPEAQYFLERSQLEQQFGPDASFAYYHGLEHYEAGELVEAIDALSIAVAVSPDFTESWRWLARALMENCVSQDALWAWQNYAERAPYDQTASYFVDVVTEQVNWGCEAGQAYSEGLSLYEDGDVLEANQYFSYAASLNEKYLDANRWAARTHQELGASSSALFYWNIAHELSPDDEVITYFIDVLEGNIAAAPIN